MVIRYNYAFLLAGLLFLLVGGAASIDLPGIGSALVMEITATGIIVIGVWTLVRSRKAFLLGWVLAGASVLLNLAAQATGSLELRYAVLLVLLVFFSITSVIAVYDVLFGGRIDVNRLIGAVCVYLLSGVIWGLVFFFLHLGVPGSFRGLAGGEWNEQVHELVYYSFVTLTTLGYGEIAPVAPLARALCYLEAVLGQLYLTVLVAALVGLHIAGHHAPPAISQLEEPRARH